MWDYIDLNELTQSFRAISKKTESSTDDAVRALWTWSKKLRSVNFRYTHLTKDPLSVLFAEALFAQIEYLRLNITERYAVKIKPFEAIIHDIGSAVTQSLESPEQRLAKQIQDIFLLRQDGYLVPIEERKETIQIPGIAKAPTIWAIADPGERFIVASGFLREDLMFFDFLLENEDWIVEQYAKKIREFESEGHPVSHLCFIHKEVGAQGPIAIEAKIRQQFPKKGVIYYMQNDLDMELAVHIPQGQSPPTKTDVVCILYDLVITGSGLQQASKAIKQKYGCESVAVVLLIYPDSDYPEQRQAEIVKRTQAIFPSEVIQVVEDYRKDVDEYLETTGEPTDMEEEIDRMLYEKSYRKLNLMLRLDREDALDVLFRKTGEGEISLETEEGKQIWQNVIKFHLDRYGEKEIDPVYSRLAECSRTRFQKASNEFIYDALFAIHGGANADFRAGFWLADKYAKRSLDRRIKKVKKTLQG